jgi:polyhydroxybutyrate depolymerase
MRSHGICSYIAQMRRFLTVLLAAALVAGCSDSNETSTTSDSAATTTVTSEVAVTSTPTTDTPVTATPTTEAPPTSATSATSVVTDPLADRPFDVFVPSTYDEASPMPLLVLLHGYSVTGSIQEVYFQFEPLAEERGFLYVRPEGTTNVIGDQFWNATEACCGFISTVDDSAYLKALIEQVQADYNVDPQRIFLVGHSNGGFMSYRMACDHSDTIAAVASLAGATFLDSADCAADEPVSVLQIHGTADATIAFDGDALFGRAFPSATETVASWAEINGCGADTTVTENALDLVVDLEGNESSRTTYTGCPDGVDVELWTIEGGSHIPSRTPDLSTGIIDFLFAHPKP